jgi:hypothetical protein
MSGPSSGPNIVVDRHHAINAVVKSVGAVMSEILYLLLGVSEDCAEPDLSHTQCRDMEGLVLPPASMCGREQSAGRLWDLISF